MADFSQLGAGSRYAPRTVPSSYNTPLRPLDELAFRQWVSQNGVPFNPDAPAGDYDMRGFYSALGQGDPRAATAVNSNDGRLHFPDVWKTPTHKSFSAESQWAGPGAPSWNESDQLVSPAGRVVFDERKPSESLADILAAHK